MDKKDKGKKITEIKKIAETLFSLLGIGVIINVFLEEGIYKIQLETDDPGIIIGYHGQTLRSIQKIITIITYRRLGEWNKIFVDVDNYRQRRQESLKKIALSSAQKVRFSKEPQSLPPMSSEDRRVIHLVLAGETDIETISEGEGRNRHVVIRPKV